MNPIVPLKDAGGAGQPRGCTCEPLVIVMTFLVRSSKYWLSFSSHPGSLCDCAMMCTVASPPTWRRGSGAEQRHTKLARAEGASFAALSVAARPWRPVIPSPSLLDSLSLSLYYVNLSHFVCEHHTLSSAKHTGRPLIDRTDGPLVTVN